MDEAALVELTASIEASGLLQPVIVRPRNGKYELIAGERRWRAVQRLGWPKIPAIVKDVDDQTLLTLALIENLQRNDLTAIDEAAGYQRLGKEFDLPQAEIARLVGRNRSTVANMLRLLKLPAEVKTLVQEGKLSEGHARALARRGGMRPRSFALPMKRSLRDGRSVKRKRGLGETHQLPLLSPPSPELGRGRRRRCLQGTSGEWRMRCASDSAPTCG